MQTVETSIKWHELYIRPNEPYKSYFSRIDSVVAEFKNKFDRVVVDSEIFGLIHTRVLPAIHDKLILFKTIAVGQPKWEAVKMQLVGMLSAYRMLIISLISLICKIRVAQESMRDMQLE